MSAKLRLVSGAVFLALVASACAAESADVSTSTNVPTSTTASTLQTTTTSTSSTTTTTVPSPETWNVDPGDLTNPLDILESFSYRFQWLAWEEPGSESGWATTGDYVELDATHCRLSQASFMGFTPTYEVTYIDHLAWREDVLLSTYETTREGIADFLQLCPGAPEFWTTPVFSAPSLSFENPHPGDFDGNPTLQFDVVSTSGDLTIETGSIDVNREAVPVRFELTGQATGGEFQALLGLGPEGAPDHVSFEVQYALSGLSSQSLMVRSPDGSSSRGPLGEITAQIPEFIASPVLQALVESAMSSDCASGSTTETLLADLGEEPEFDSISVVFEQGNITNHTVGTWVKGSIEEVFSTTTENEEVAEFHTLLHFNHYRGVAAFLYFVGQSPVFEARHDDRTARWNAETIEWFDGSTEDASVHQFLRFPNEGIEVPDDLTPEIDAAIADWIEAFNSVLTGITTAHPQALADLQAMVADADNIEALLCVELNRAFTVADQAFQNQGTQWVAEHPEVLADEIAAQQALLTLEYLRAIDARLSRPGIDYLNGTDVTLEESNLDGITSDIEYVKVLASAGRDALALYRDLSDLG